MTDDALPKSGGKMVNAFDPSSLASLDETTRSMVARRARLLGPAYRLFYRTPVEIVRGRGTKLYDRDGAEYLDAYNNVVAVGHAHPRVVAAVQAQMAELCTHTRYLSEDILAYAEDLLATFPDGFGADAHLMLTCTGSEANDLALRIAQHHTGRRGIIITAEAYHGNSHLTAGFSPSLGAGSPLGKFVRLIDAPDSYRLPHAEIGERMAAQVRREIADLRRHGEDLAAFVVDSAFSSDGIYTHPKGILAPVAEAVREAGGVFVADEVQSGFGRLGDHLWGYARHDFTPDIVTMGKPMGNGFPVAGIAVRDEIVRDFGASMRYFNTFGGNTVAVAAARATYDVIVEEGLVDNARLVGDRLRAGFAELASEFAVIGDVRGAGLYIGIELVEDRAGKRPSAAAATAAVNGLRQRRVLISATGPDANVLKIRPPLVFSAADADRLVGELRAVLSTLPGGRD